MENVYTKSRPVCVKGRHKWERVKSGCRENPGVHAAPNGNIFVFDACPHCKVTRRTESGNQRKDGRAVRYTKEDHHD